MANVVSCLRVPDDFDVFKKSARMIPRVISPFANVLQVMQIGLRYEVNNEHMDDDDELLEDL